MIWGAGDCGELCLRYLRKERRPAYEVVGFIDDNPAKRGPRLRGVKILGDRHHLQLIAQLYKIQRVFIAIAAAPQQELKQILRACRALGLKPQIFLTKTDVPERPLFLGRPGEPLPANGYAAPGAIAPPES